MFVEKLILADYFLTLSEDFVSNEKGRAYVYRANNMARKIENRMFEEGFSGAFSVYPTREESVFYSGYFNADHTFSAVNKIAHENGVIKVFELDFNSVPKGAPYVFGF